MAVYSPLFGSPQPAERQKSTAALPYMAQSICHEDFSFSLNPWGPGMGERHSVRLRDGTAGSSEQTGTGY